MIADWFITMVDRKGFSAHVQPIGRDDFEVSSDDARTMISLLLQRQRQKGGLFRGSWILPSQACSLPLDRCRRLVRDVKKDRVYPGRIGNLLGNRLEKPKRQPGEVRGHAILRIDRPQHDSFTTAEGNRSEDDRELPGSTPMSRSLRAIR
jgi:hypothetical protein